MKQAREYTQGYLDGVLASSWTCSDCGNTYDAQVESCPNQVLDHALLHATAPRRTPMSSDYSELPLHIEHHNDNATIDLWVTFNDTPHPTLVLKNVTSAVRYHGWWTIEHTMPAHQPATAYIEAATVRMFSAVTRAPTEKHHDTPPDKP